MMASHSMSDTIEEYLKQLLVNADAEQVEIRRADLALRFDVVPSQINYVIKTRFTIQDGYLVQSKRGGGGYIRIERIKLMQDADVFDQLIASIGDQLTNREATVLLQTLAEHGILSQREVTLIAALLAPTALAVTDRYTEVQVRARIMRSLLMRLKYEC
ncbi:Transcriptional regulator CtsR [Fructilactobacillus florum 8D]|uniref:Transcriptional regulator CtsR n=2 Tax=Fructilactobacillus florum TaxID=640331 RepID=W9EHI5_9LACO|nr:Transcriptional regulator CtsR [Fructilactobacillus florum 2F]ETO40440.1 Transcriptional regulator CtsR [Fructilactobacillus florum 8D]